MKPPEEDDGDVMVTPSLFPLRKQISQKSVDCLVKEELTWTASGDTISTWKIMCIAH